MSKLSRFASRAGEKLQYALDQFNLSVKGLICADFGCSTGGFTDCLLQNGVRKVYSVDTAYGELAWKLRNDKRIVVMERTNAMHVILPEKIDLITVDVSWTKQEKVLPNVFTNLKKDGSVISLVKPHYEAGKARLHKEEVEQVIKEVVEKIKEIGGEVKKITESPVLGGKGKNIEYLALIQGIKAK